MPSPIKERGMVPSIDLSNIEKSITMNRGESFCMSYITRAEETSNDDFKDLLHILKGV